MKTYVLTCQKGGVAKTTTAYTLANGLLNKGYRVLGLDLDPQCNFSQTAGIDVLRAKSTIYEVMKGKATAKEAKCPVKIGFDVIPGNLALASADMEFMQTGRERMLRKALQPIQGDYDFCVIDTSPHMGILTINALTAADRAIIPITADVFALQGLTQLKGVIESVQEYTNEGLAISGLLLTRYNDRTNATKTIMEIIGKYADELGAKVFKTKIRESVVIRESQIIRTDLFSDYSKADVTQDYQKFIDELLESEG